MLKDVLRQYEGQETHTVHLVCSSPRISQMKQQNQAPQQQQQPHQSRVNFLILSKLEAILSSVY